MKNTVYFTCILMLFFAVSLNGFCHAESAKANFAGNTGTETLGLAVSSEAAQGQLELKKACLAATVEAIKLEMKRYQGWIEWKKLHGEQDELPDLQQSLGKLQADLEKYLAMDPEEYVLPEKTTADSAVTAFLDHKISPEKITTTAWVSDKQPGINSILYVNGMSRSGPWYHVAGILDDNYAAVKPGVKYQMSFYTVYPRQYGWMHSAYVYIAQINETAAPNVRGQGFASKALMNAANLDITKDIETEPQDAAGYFHRAEALDKDGRPFEARKDYVEAIRLGEKGGLSEADIATAKRRCTKISQMASEAKKITGEVFAYVGMLNNHDERAKCDKYRVYLLENEDDRAGKLVLDAKESSFTFMLTASDLKKYPLMEFVSPYGTKTVALSDVSDEPLTIVLERKMILKKPAIYLYPSQAMQVSVTHRFKGKILNTYPVYLDGWTVMAEPNGNLRSLKDGREYKYLFWEGSYLFPKEHYQYTSGFYVKKADYVAFLQEKLAKIGLNNAEINDFIVYWLPAMGKYNNCFIHFSINDDIDGTSVLETKPAADTTIRVFMEFSGLQQLENVKKLPQQQLPVFERKGFTLVEWGGSEIGGNHIE